MASRPKHNGFNEDAFRLPEKVLRQFYTKNGWLTRYALACGYIERAEVGETKTVTLWMEHGMLHLRTFFKATGERVERTFDSLKEARVSFTEGLAV